tara:strand:+ start:433 stop:624 length:192 start_codon:yes stop_codon:yes gene_type:complete
MAHAANSELQGSPRKPAFAFKLQDALVIFKRDKAEEKEDYYLKMYSTAKRCAFLQPVSPRCHH